MPLHMKKLMSSSIMLACVHSVLGQDNLVRNPGFETGDISPWTPGNSDFDWTLRPSFVERPHTGDWVATSGAPFKDQPSNIQQNVLNTIPTVCYQISFWVRNFGQAANANLDNTGVTANFGAATFGPIIPPTTYTEYTFYARAEEADQILSIQGYNEPASTGHDDISVRAATIDELPFCPLLPTGIISRRQRRSRHQTVFDSCTAQAGHRMCPITAGSPNLICVDTAAEIEYCGESCENCLNMAGAEDVACSEGRCVASSCAEGFRLGAGACV